MKARIVSIGKTRQAFLLDGEAEYLKRLRPHLQLEVVELGADKYSALPDEQAREKEAAALLAAVRPAELLVALDEQGREFDSLAFAEWLERTLAAGRPVCFAIGGASGWHPAVRERADQVLSLSRLTFPHQLSRLLLIEQLYRATEIRRGGPYHK